MADVFNAEVVTLKVGEGAAYGAALQALWCWRSTGMTHAASRRGRGAGDEASHRLRAVGLDPFRRLLLRCTANLPIMMIP
jgi:sugar (pentulose or hexulose) kinase